MPRVSRFAMRCLSGVVAGAFLAGSAAAGDWVGTPAPAVQLHNQNDEVVDLAQFRGHWLAIYFYPKDGTPGCTEEAKRFVEMYDRLKAKDVDIVGISLDDVESHHKFAERLHVRFNLLADREGLVAKQFGVLHGVGPVKFAGRETFLVDPDGVIVYHYPEVNSREHATQVLHDVERLQGARATEKKKPH